MATSAQVQQLYIALLGRAADKPGLDWWLENINGTDGVPGERTLEQAAAAFTTSEEFVSTYGSLQGAELVTAVYSNLFERTPSAEEVAYWVNDGRPADQLLAAFLTYASPADQTVINNKVLVAQYYTEAAGADYDLGDAADVIDAVDGTPGSVAAALQSEYMPINNSAVLTALAKWQAAVEAKATFLEGLADLDNDPATPNNDQHVTDELTAKLGTFNGNTYSTANLAATSNATEQEAAFTLAREALKTAITGLQGSVKTAQEAVDALNDRTDVNAYIVAKDAATTAETNATVAAATALGAAAKFDALPGATTTIDTTADYSFNAVTGKVELNAASDLASVIELKDGALVIKSTVTEAAKPSVTELLKAINDDIAAQKADAVAQKTLTNATAKVGDGSAADLQKVTDLIAAQKAVTTAQTETTAALEKAITELKDAYSLNGQLTKLTDAVLEAQKGVEANLNGGKVEVVDAANETGTAGKADLFVFNGKAGSITSGDFESLDKLFIGSKYTLVDISEAVADGKALGTDAFGSASTLEVFWDSNNNSLNFEKQAFSGNVAGSSEFVKVVLTGVTDVELNNGFITEVA